MDEDHLKARLNGRRVLVVEDEYILAEDLRDALTSAGALVLGPVGDSDSAKSILDTENCDCAILDINLKGEQSFKIARLAIEKGIPGVFTTGYDRRILPSGLETFEVFEKPLDMSKLLEFVADRIS